MRTFGIYENCIQCMAIPQHKYPSFIQRAVLTTSILIP